MPRGQSSVSTTELGSVSTTHLSYELAPVRERSCRSSARNAGHLFELIGRARVANLYTDAYGSYTGLDERYVHQVIDHAECYAKGQVHTHGLENFWSLLKRAIKGTFVSVEPFHLFRYLDEESFRFNARRDDDGGRFIEVLRSVGGRRLTYSKSIGESESPSIQ